MIALPHEFKQQLSYWLLVVKVAKHGFPLEHNTIDLPVSAIKVYSDAAKNSTDSKIGAGSIRFETGNKPIYLTYMI